MGGMFGPTKKGNASRSGGDVFLGTDANGQLIITGSAGKRFDSGAATAEVQAQLNAINAQIGARGLSFAGAGQGAIGFGQASGAPRELSLTSLVGQLRGGNANQMTAFGTLAYTPGTNSATNIFQLIASNSVSLQAITSTVSIVSIPLRPLQVRVINKSGVPDSQVQIMQIDTGTNSSGIDTDGYPNTVFFNSDGADVPLANGVSTNLNALPQTIGGGFTNRTFYISNSVSGTLWFCLSNVPYVKGTNANPAVVNTKWSR
jgi:hypothetical protein